MEYNSRRRLTCLHRCRGKEVREMKTLVTYVSNTGNTRKVAEAICDELPDEKEIKEISEVSSLEGYDLSFIGFPINANGPNPKAAEFLEKSTAGRKIAIFITHGAPDEHDDVEVWKEKCRRTAAGADIVGIFNCQGEVDPAVVDFLLKSDDPRLRSFGEQAPSTKGQPDESRLKRAREFVNHIVNKI